MGEGWSGGAKNLASSKAEVSSWAFLTPGLCYEHVRMFNRLG